MGVPQGGFCQSCAMPMDAPDDFGTNADGSKSEEFCARCYQNGSFTQPDATVQDMIELCAGIMAERMGMKREDARARLSQFMPKLRRWQGGVAN